MACHKWAGDAVAGLAVVKFAVLLVFRVFFGTDQEKVPGNASFAAGASMSPSRWLRPSKKSGSSLAKFRAGPKWVERSMAIQPHRLKSVFPDTS